MTAGKEFVFFGPVNKSFKTFIFSEYKIKTNFFRSKKYVKNKNIKNYILKYR